MNVDMDSATLRDALRIVSKHFSRYGTFPSESLVSVTTRDDGEIVTLRRAGFDVDARAYVVGNSEGPGASVFVDAKELERSVPKRGVVKLRTDEDRLVLDSGSSSVSIPTKDGDDVMPERDDAAPFARVDMLESDAVLGVLSAAGREDARAVLTAAAIRPDGNGGGTIAATDTYRLHGTRLAFVDGESSDELLVPADVLAFATKTAAYGVGIGRGDGYATLRYTAAKGPKRTPRVVECWTAVRTVEGPFPNYYALIPDTDDAPVRWTVIDAAGTASALSPHENRANAPVMLTAAGSAVAAVSNVEGTETAGTLPIGTDGGEFSLALNPGYAADAFQHAGDGATVYLRDPLKAIYAENGDTFALLMPMRVS